MTMPAQGLAQIASAAAARTMDCTYKLWGFGESIAIRALWQAAAALDAPHYRVWVIEMLEKWLRRDPPLQEADHSAPGRTLLDAYAWSHDARYLVLALALTGYLVGLPREIHSGASFHRPLHPEHSTYVYVDCMEVDAPFLCRLAQVTGRAAYHDLAVGQIEGYSQLLQDPETGLFYHAFDGATGETNGAFWGRGNGWAMLGLVETLSMLPREHVGWGGLHARLSRLAERLAVCQLPSGDWPTVLDDPATYAEGSLAAMFYYAYTEGIRRGLLDRRYQEVAERAWGAFWARLSAEGVLQGVSIATPPGDAAHYAQMPTLPAGQIGAWGQGPALLACLARLHEHITESI